ncbi:glycosyltransferase 87 family protein [uncultured Schumannella sp.]|uniref:glycosyltransferase 87 family protein n=1 Tax=uncultured Schumannella sp. TaxID=1195956 RepID=UPI0025EE39EB|nr:glycosyltransferase 87 family protein [uncultured Schumannella sp.]
MPPATRGRRIRDAASHPIALWLGFVLAHLWLGMLGLYAPGNPLGDVGFVYRFWMEYGQTTGQWVGIDTVWVYPILALVPMLAATVLGLDLYVSTWLSLMMLVNAAAFAVLLSLGARPHGARRIAPVAWWWIAFLVLLGPVALGRIDTVTVAVALAGVVVLQLAPRAAGILLTVAAWIKVWPAALVAAIVLVDRSRIRVAVAAAATTVVVLAVALAAGAGGTVFSFITEQTGRGLQIEAISATAWMWDAAIHPAGASAVYYDTSILTFQLRGDGVAAAAAIATPLLAVAVAVLLVAAVVALRRGVASAELLPVLALAITTALIVFNKVGSPQFVSWLAVPVIWGLVSAVRGEGSSFRVPAVLTLLIAVLTQAIYPFLYDDLVALGVVPLVVLTARNLLYLVLFGWAVWTLAGLVTAVRAPRADARSANTAGWSS